MLRAILFDFNGVIIDDEPLHFLAFRTIFEKEGIRLTKRDYMARYLAYDDRSCIREVLLDHHRESSTAAVRRLRGAKERAYRALLKTRIRLFPGAIEFIRECAACYPLAIASGALSSEIESILVKFRLRRYFAAVVSADDVVHGKPHPETFLRAWKALNRRRPRGESKILVSECLIIEDSLHGIKAAHHAGMRCVAVAHSYPLRELEHADFRTRSIGSLQLSDLEALFADDRDGANFPLPSTRR
ncbi:MAG: HAD family phosphatase [Acidobacteriia bacterium]|nr:HAD family phosphatase [Terriglobia bacterium]